MKALKELLIISSLVVSVLAASPVLARKTAPAINDDGMELIKDTKYSTVYADPDANLGNYTGIWLQDASVEFKKNWKRNQNRNTAGTMLRVKDSDVERIQEDMATLFREVFTAELLEGGYQLVEEAGENVLIARPAIVDLDIFAPDLRTAQRNFSYSESAGEMTLMLDLYDSLTNDKIVTSKDRQRDFERGFREWRTSVNNRATAKRMISSWATAFTELLDYERVSVADAD